jgi:transposase
MNTASLLEEKKTDILIVKERSSIARSFPTSRMRYQMEGSLLLSLGESLLIEQVSHQERHVIISVRSTASQARCPLCRAPSESIHSHYMRTVADLPFAGQFVVLKLIVRRFFCRNPSCSRTIFTERLPDLVHPWAQMTNRLREALRALGFATCAEAGSRLAPRFGMKASPSTFLRCQKTTSLATPEPFTKVGLDDFAFRRGRTYGTIIVNLETHRLIDVLPDRTVATVAAWLAAHPDIDVISRDRASDYATAATLGAPQALQVCDRWHLLRNLSEYVTTFLARMRASIRKASQEQAPPVEEDPLAEAQWKEREASEQARNTRRQERRVRNTVQEQTKATRQAERLDRYEQMIALKSQGLSPEEIAPRVGCSARTVRQWLTDGITTTPRRRRPSPLDAYASYLRRRWEEGVQQGEKLYRELQEKGYTGSSRAVYRYLNRWRPPRMESGEPIVRKHRPRKTAPPPGPFDECHAKQAVWLYLRSPDELNKKEREQVAFIRQVHPSLDTAYQLVQAFVKMVREHRATDLACWLEQVHTSTIAELIRFAKGIERELAPVQAALQLPWSQGVVEGHVHRLKLIKRQGYGRASFELLRQRVLYQAV